MGKRLSRQEKKQIIELDSTGIAIEDVYGSKKSSPLFLCLSKALIIFLVCVGTVTGFCDAFSLNYNKGTIVIFTLAASIMISLLYFNKKVFYIGYIAFLIIFTVELLRYYLYANSGFQAITNHIREVYAEFFNMGVVRSAEETYTNRQLTITIALIFIISFLVIMYNITVSRYMNFAETFGISFILMQIPLYIGYKPPLISVILIMTGCIATGLLQKGAFNRVTIPGKNAPDYIKDRLFKKTYYTTRGDHRGILMVLAISAVFSFVICIFSLPAYSRDLGETPEDSAKASLDDTVKILVQNGIYGLFNSYDSINGLSRGRLGGVSAVNPDFKTDIVVTFVPYSDETIYLPGFKGVSYAGKSWLNRVNIAEFPKLGLGSQGYIESDIIDIMDKTITSSKLKTPNSVSEKKSTRAKAQISYIDKSFGMLVNPYVTLPSDVRNISEDPIYKPVDPEKETVLETKEVDYYPLSLIEYLEPGDPGYGDSISGLGSVKLRTEINNGIIGTYNEDEYDNEYPGVQDINVTRNTTSENSSQYLRYYDYINDICLKVPDDLDRYLEEFCKEHNYFGLDTKNYKRLKLTVDAERQFPAIDYEAIPEEFIDRLRAAYDSSDMASLTALTEEYNYYTTPSEKILQERYEHKEEINSYRLKLCEALKDMFLAEYPYTLSPGKTPNNEDYVRYFLETQKRGLCSHFASAGVMILRHMGVPARYIEGYCIPHSLMSEEATKAELYGDEWFMGENEYNTDKTAYSVPVSDYYAHAWIEIYLEGKGWIPYELTPPSFEAAPVATEMSGIGRFFSQLLNVDLGLGNNNSDSSVSIVGDDTPVAMEEDLSDKDLAIFVYPLILIIGAVVLFWMLFLLIRKIVLEMRYAKYLKEGKFAPVVYARYNELVKKLKRKKIVAVTNPLPLEVCKIISEYQAEKVLEKTQTSIENQENSLVEGYNVKYSENLPVFKYIEKVLYSDYQSNVEEYEKNYQFLKSIG